MNDFKYSIVTMATDKYDMNKEFLAHLEAYTPFEYELVYVDDASTESNIELFKQHKAEIVSFSQWVTVPVGKNAGTEMAKGEFIFWLDNDCFVGEDWYKPLIQKIEEDEQYGLVGQPKDIRKVKRDFMEYMNEDAVMQDDQFIQAGLPGELCDFFMGYCMLLRKKAFLPTHDFGLPTPTIDPELGLGVKKKGYLVVATDSNVNVNHVGSQTPRPYPYKHLLVETWIKWWKEWEPYKYLLEEYKNEP